MQRFNKYIDAVLVFMVDRARQKACAAGVAGLRPRQRPQLRDLQWPRLTIVSNVAAIGGPGQIAAYCLDESGMSPEVGTKKRDVETLTGSLKVS
jgi:hypothetical protein